MVEKPEISPGTMRNTSSERTMARSPVSLVYFGIWRITVVRNVRTVPNCSTMTSNFAAADLSMLFSGSGGGFPFAHSETGEMHKNVNRGRNAGYPAPPAQIRTRGITSYYVLQPYASIAHVQTCGGRGQADTLVQPAISGIGPGPGSQRAVRVAKRGRRADNWRLLNDHELPRLPQCRQVGDFRCVRRSFPCISL